MLFARKIQAFTDVFLKSLTLWKKEVRPNRPLCFGKPRDIKTLRSQALLCCSGIYEAHAPNGAYPFLGSVQQEMETFKGIAGLCEIVPPSATRCPKMTAEDTRAAENDEDISLMLEEKLH